MERLYYENAYLTEFSAVVTQISENGIVLDKTAFFPEGGGQSSDRGTLSGVKVSDVQEKDGIIYHITNDTVPFCVGETVKGKIDFHKRFSDMQNHSGEHIVSGLVHNIFGFENVGFHLNDNEIALDFSGVIQSEKISEIELLANKAVWDNTEIRAFFPDSEERENISYRSKKNIDDNLRLVEIKGIDICACCAPHVRRTGEIGLIKIVGHEKHRGGTRLYILCGERALNDYSMKQTENKKIGNMLKAKECETSSAVEALLKKKADLEYEITRLNIESAKSAAEAYEKADIIIAVDRFTGQALTHFANALKEKAEKLVAAFGKTDENTYQYMIISNGMDISSLVKSMNSALCGRGGGKNGVAQGSVNCEKCEISNFFNNFGI